MSPKSEKGGSDVAPVENFSQDYFENLSTAEYSKFIHLSRYARYREEFGRRETWSETVDRYLEFFDEHIAKNHPQALQKYQSHRDAIKSSILNFEVLPSMRALMVAGKTLVKNNISSYNCAFGAIDGNGGKEIVFEHEELDEPIRIKIANPIAFDEAMVILMHGTGVGFSVEERFVKQLPRIGKKMNCRIYLRNNKNYPGVPKEDLSVFDRDTNTIIAADTREGWGSALRILIVELYNGNFAVKWDLSGLRKAGERLKTFGGRASGPAPLDELFRFCVQTFRKASGRRLKSIEAHDVMGKIAAVVVAGSSRRSAMISLSDLNDEDMRHAKHGNWWEDNQQRALANNSVSYKERPDTEAFLREWKTLIESKAGERGIINLAGMRTHAAKTGKRNPALIQGVNPCGEIALRNRQFCNLSSVVIRPEDTEDMLKKKVAIATILGTLQSSLTDFKYISEEWKKNCEEERLLGVSMSGILDNPLTAGTVDREQTTQLLKHLRELSNEINKEWAHALDINKSVSIGTVKPEGCRPWDALVTTDEGMYTLEDLLETHNTTNKWHPISGYNAIGGGKLTRTYMNGEAEITRIEMVYGMQLESTANHMWSVVGKGWVRTDALQVGDKIEIYPNLYEKNTDAELLDLVPAAISIRHQEKMAFPKTLNPELAWFLGYLWGDGAMSPQKYRLRFVDRNTENLEKTAGIFKTQFGLESTIFKCNDRDASSLEVGSKLLWHWLIKNDVWKYYAGDIDIIPRKVRESSKESIIAFLAGLIDADGWFGMNKKEKTYKSIFTTHSKLFANHIQHIGWSVGVCFGNSKNVRGDSFQKQKEMYLMAITGASDAKSLQTLRKHSLKIKRPLGAETQIKIIHPGRIKKITSAGTRQTYDVETEQHWFYAGSVKSHNTASQLSDSASGIHPRYAKYYVRTVRIDKKDPIYQFMVDRGFPVEDDVTNPSHTAVFSFPIKSPEKAVLRDDITAIDQLNLWKLYADNWCEHQPSITVYVRDTEWMSVAAWVYEHFDVIRGISFLPYADHIYKQAPYQPITPEEYDELSKKMPKNVNWKQLAQYEEGDNTVGGHSFACSAGSCEIVDLVR